MSSLWWATKNEWLGLLDVAELDLEALYGGYDGEPFDDASSELRIHRTSSADEPRPAGDDHRGSRDQRAISHTPERNPGERFGEAPAAGAET